MVCFASGICLCFFSDDCGEVKVLSGDNGTIKSHSLFGIRDYYNNMSCEWSIVGREGQVIAFHFVAFEVESGSNGSTLSSGQDCDTDSLTIYDGAGSDRSKLNVVCGSELPLDMYTSGPNASLSFKTNEAVTKKGFLLSYSIVDEPGKLR